MVTWNLLNSSLMEIVCQTAIAFELLGYLKNDVCENISKKAKN